jgi:hypothetical protein
VPQKRDQSRRIVCNNPVEEVRRRESPDAMVCDFLTPAVNIDDLSGWVLFQHNLEMLIWCRHAEHAGNAASKFYCGKQADRMFQAEKTSAAAFAP